MKRLLAMALCLFLLTGCQLAQKPQGEKPLEDRLVGVFVTQDYLDLLDLETYLQEHPEDVLDGELEPMDRGRVYATMSADGTFYFEGYEGMYLCNYYDGETQCSFSTEGLCDVEANYADTNAGRVIEEKGTIRITGTEGISFYTNPVYQTHDGRYYVMEGQGTHSNSLGTMSHTLTEETTIRSTQDGETTQEESYKASFTVTVEHIEIPDTVTFVQMSADNRELSRQECLPGQMPEQVEAVAGTAYILLESRVGETVTRVLHQPGEDSIRTWYKSESAVCLPQYTEVIWP